MFIINLCSYYIVNFARTNAVFKLKLTLSITLFSMQLHFTEGDFKSDYLFRACSVAQEFIPIAVLLRCAVLANYGAVPYLIVFNPKAALLQQCYKKIRNRSGRA